MSLIIMELPKTTKGMLTANAKISRSHAAFGGSGHADHVVQAHHQVGNQNGANWPRTMVDCCRFAALFLIFFAQQLGANPATTNRRNNLQIRHLPTIWLPR
jgi:hypothetical protein